jgi:2-polyprenyl-6-methoxyphenol hydroxylase-like FAD-dependent oxidoreductase
VIVRLADGTEEHADLLVGADGLRSAIRAQLVDPSPPKYAGYVIWRTIVDYDRDDVPYGLFRITWGRGRRFVFFHVQPGRLYWSAVANAPEGGGDSPRGRMQGLLEMYKGWPDPINQILAAADETTITRADNYDRDPVQKWGEGRVTLLGDAAHPMTFNVGQGACQAVEDGLALASELAAGGDIAEALRRYEDRRRERTAQLMKQSRRIGALGMWTNPIACRVREQVQKRVIAKALGKAAQPAASPT